MAKNEQMLRLVLIEQLLRRRKDRGDFKKKVSRLNLQNALFSETKLPLQMFLGYRFHFLESEMYIL